jgi:triosephosphate isomerase
MEELAMQPDVDGALVGGEGHDLAPGALISLGSRWRF